MTRSHSFSLAICFNLIFFPPRPQINKTFSSLILFCSHLKGERNVWLEMQFETGASNERAQSGVCKKDLKSDHYFKNHFSWSCCTLYGSAVYKLLKSTLKHLCLPSNVMWSVLICFAWQSTCPVLQHSHQDKVREEAKRTSTPFSDNQTVPQGGAADILITERRAENTSCSHVQVSNR